jgi:hypothetical protein
MLIDNYLLYYFVKMMKIIEDSVIIVTVNHWEITKRCDGNEENEGFDQPFGCSMRVWGLNQG